MPEKIVFGGRCDAKACRIEPTVMVDVDWEDAVMREEIFGPLLPILTYKNINDAWKMSEKHLNLLIMMMGGGECRVPK